MVVKEGTLVQKYFDEFNLNCADSVTKLVACELLSLVYSQYDTSEDVADSGVEDARDNCYPAELFTSEELVKGVLNLAGSWSNDLIILFSESLRNQGIDSKLIDMLDTNHDDYFAQGFGAIHAFLMKLGYKMSPRCK